MKEEDYIQVSVKTGLHCAMENLRNAIAFRKNERLCAAYAIMADEYESIIDRIEIKREG